MILVGAGYVVDFESIIGDVSFDTETAQQVGFGGIMHTLQKLLNLIMNLDELMQIFGALMLFLTAVMLGVYWFTRDPTLVVEVVGDDIHVPRPPEDADEYANRLEGAIDPEPGTVAPPESAEGGVDRDPLGES